MTASPGIVCSGNYLDRHFELSGQAFTIFTISTHPDTGRRIEGLRQLASALPQTDLVPLAIDWDEVAASLAR